jgi:hypothetical protein
MLLTKLWFKVESMEEKFIHIKNQKIKDELY